MMFTTLEIWLLSWFTVISVLGNLALVFSLFEKTGEASKKLIFITMAITIPLLMFFWIVDTIFKRTKLKKDIKEKQHWVEGFTFLDNLNEGPTWIKAALENKQLYYQGPDLIVKTSEGDVKVEYEDMILKYSDNTLGVMAKEVAQEVRRHE